MNDVRIVKRVRRDRLGEGPLWHPYDESLYWVDVLDKLVHRLHLPDQSLQSWTMPEMVGWIIPRRDAEGFLAGLKSGIASVKLDPLRIEIILKLPSDEPACNRLNDAKEDARGRLWFGSMPLDADKPTGSLYRFDIQGNISRMDEGYYAPNGPAFSPNGKFLLHTDTIRREIYRFALNDDGSLGPRRTFLRFDERWGWPDGMSFDAEGGLWIAHWGGGRVSRFDAQGRMERSITLPASQITSVAFGGEKLDRLFVTSAADGVDESLAGSLFEVDPGVRGVAAFSFGQNPSHSA